MTSINPWTAPTPEQTLLAILAEQGCHGNVADSDIQHNISLRIISALTDLSSLSEQIRSAELELLQRSLHKDNADLVTISHLDQIHRHSDEISSHLSLILEHRESLCDRLKCPHESGQLVIEARYQKYAVSTFENLGKVLSQLTVYLHNVDQYKSVCVSEGSVERSTQQILEHTQTLNSLYNNIQSTHRALLAVSEKGVVAPSRLVV